MRSLFAGLGVDYDQWKALTIVALKLDFRTSSMGRSRMGREARGAAALIGQFAFYTIVGVAMSALVWFMQDLFVVGTVAMTYIMFMVGTAVLIDHNSAITSPDDYVILGFRPISSRTYFAARLTNVLVYTLSLTTVAAYLPIASFFIRHGGAVGIASILAFYGCAITVTLLILAGYAAMLRVIGPAALKRGLSYMQLIMSFSVYGGYFFMTRVASRSIVSAFTLPKTWWMALYPGAWFASYLEIASGQVGLWQIGTAFCSVALLVTLAWGLQNRLSLGYSEHLGAISVSSSRPSAKAQRASRPGLWFRTGEARAVALLIRSQFRNDQKFRMGVLSILPLTLIYIFMGINRGSIGDPFVARESSQGFSMVAIAVLMFPSMLKMQLVRSDYFRASWIFFACPSDRIRIVRSAKHVLVAFFLVPYLVFVSAVLSYFAGNVPHVLVHMSLLGLISYFMLQVVILVDPELPFSRPMQKGRNSGVVIALMAVMGISATVLTAFAPVLYGSLLATLVAFGFVIAAIAVVDRLTRVRVEWQTKALEFEG